MAETKPQVNIQISELNSKNQKLGTSSPKPSSYNESDISKFEKSLILAETTAFVIILGFLIASLASHKLHNKSIWDTKIWKWSLLALSILCGRLTGFLLTEAAMYLIWRSTWVNEKVLYFAYGIKKSVILFIWLTMITITWVLQFHIRVTRSEHDEKIEHKITKALVGVLVGSAIWMVKTLGIKAIGSVHARKLFGKMKHIITFRVTLLEISKGVEVEISPSDFCKKRLLYELIKSIRGERLQRFSYHHSDMRKEIGNAKDAREAAENIFFNLGGREVDEDDEDEVSPGNQSAAKTPKCYVDLEKVMKCVRDERVRKHFEGAAEVKKIVANNNNNINNEVNSKQKYIKRSIFRKWLVDVFNEYESLNNTLEHTKMAIDDFNKIASIVAIVIIIIVLLLFMDYLTIKAILLLSSQFVLLGFIFGNTMKTLFEAVIFVFFIHPFDVGDRCIIDGIEMIVDEERMLITKFLKSNGEKVYYPNAILFNKPISNLYRSPPMGDVVQFAIDLSTPIHVLEQLQQKIRIYLASNPRRWKEDFNVLFSEIEDMNKLKVDFCFGHTLNFHHASKRAKRRSLLVIEIKKILENLQIKYHLLPQEVHLKYI